MVPWISKKRRQDNLLQTQAQSTPSLFYYRGQIKGLQQKLIQTANNPYTQIINVHIIVVGNQLKQTDTCCLVLTVFLGICFIFPWFVFLCDWWKKMVGPAYQIPISVYQQLSILFSKPSVQSINIEIYDNAFGRQKSILLYNMLSTSQVKNFQIYNSAENIDFYERQFKDFVQHMKPIKMLPLQSYIRWYNVVVQ